MADSYRKTQNSSQAEDCAKELTGGWITRASDPERVYEKIFFFPFLFKKKRTVLVGKL